MSAPAIELVDVRKNFGPTEIIRGVSWQVIRGERHAMIGPNGAGKSTLFNLISGRLAPTAGAIRLNGADITGLKPFEINRRGLSRSFQVTNIFPRLSVWENIRCAVLWSLGYRYSFWHGINALPDVRERTEQIMEEIHLADRRRIQAGVLTYAEQRALEIGITIAGGADIILLDEPSAGMSHAEAEQAVALIRKVSAGRTLVMIEHDMGVVFDLADRISVLVYGQVIACDAPAKIKADPAVQQAYLGTAVAA
jgi:branched-chain amino acid transport system ATP-binding protein